MVKKTISLFIRSAFVFAILFEHAIADDCKKDNFGDLSYNQMFSEFFPGCFRHAKLETDLSKQVTTELSNLNINKRVRAQNAIDAILDYISANYLVPDNSKQHNAAIINSSADRLIKSIEQNPPNNPERILKSNWGWTIVDQPPRELDGLDFKKYLSGQNCDKVGDSKCESDYKRAAELAQSILLMNEAIDLYTEDFRAEVLKDRELRRKKWDSYYDDLTFQYFWEAMANNSILDRNDDRTELDNNKIGFRSLPTWKLVLLHPEVNLMFNDSVDDKFEEVVTVELVGYEVFKFGATGKVKDQWGVSALAALTNSSDDGDNNFSYGLLFKKEGYSIGFTDNDGDTAIIFNFNLSQKLLDIDEKYRRYYD